MEIKEIGDKDSWDAFLTKQKYSSFLQASQWLDFQKNWSRKVFPLAVLGEREEILAVAGLLLKDTPLKKPYLYCPRGPVLKEESGLGEEVWKKLMKGIKDRAESEGAVFLRLEPSFFPPSDLTPLLERSVDIQPSRTLILNLDQEESSLLQGMHQKTRYNIRLAAKKGVEVRAGQRSDFDQVWKLLEQTGQRDGFRSHSKKYYQKMLDTDQDLIKMKVAVYEGRIIAMGIFSFFSPVVTYMHGASSYEYRSLMAPYALQWSAMTEGRALGYLYYDFYGIDEDKWPGVTRFKLGFGGSILEMPGTFDLPFNQRWYNIYKFLRKIRRRS